MLLNLKFRLLRCFIKFALISEKSCFKLFAMRKSILYLPFISVKISGSIFHIRSSYKNCKNDFNLLNFCQLVITWIDEYLIKVHPKSNRWVSCHSVHFPIHLKPTSQPPPGYFLSLFVFIVFSLPCPCIFWRLSKQKIILFAGTRLSRN